MLKKKLVEATRILKKGGVVVFPTETAYAIGCRLDNPKAVKRLIKIRERKEGKPFLVLAADLGMAKIYWQKLPLAVETLAQKFWPGPLTIVYFCQKKRVPFLVRAGGETLGIRVPGYGLIRKLVKQVGVPILAPSANFAEKKTPFAFSDLDKKLLKKVDFVLEIPCGGFDKPSTVIDCSQEPFLILREGAISKKEIFAQIEK